MRTIQKRYKTLKGFEKAVGHNCCDLDKVFEGYDKYETKGKKLICFHLTLDEKTARKEAAELLAKCWSKPYRKRVVEKVMAFKGDYSYLQCFHLDHYFGEFRVGNSLSGSSYDYCKRKWLNS